MLMIVLVDKEDTVFSARGRQILCAVNGKETAGLWTHCMADVVAQLNVIISNSLFAIDADGVRDKVKVDFFLGSSST